MDFLFPATSGTDHIKHQKYKTGRTGDPKNCDPAPQKTMSGPATRKLRIRQKGGAKHLHRHWSGAVNGTDRRMTYQAVCKKEPKGHQSRW